MIQHTLMELAVAFCFSSHEMLGLLMTEQQQRQSRPTPPKTINARCRAALQQGLDRDYPRRFRPTDLALAYQTIWPDSMFMNNNMPLLSMMFDRLMWIDGDLMQYQQQKVTEYVRMATRIDPALIASWMLAQRLWRRPASCDDPAAPIRPLMLQCSDLRRIVQVQQPMFSPLPAQDRPVAENHAHLGGSHDEGMAMMALLLSPALSAIAPDNADLQLAQALAIGLIRLGPAAADAGQHATTSYGALHELLSAVFHHNTRSERAQAAYQLPYWPLYHNESQQSTQISARWLRRELALSISDGDFGTAWFWFLLLLWYLYIQVDDAYIRRSIYFVLTSLMTHRRKLIMDGTGLANFVRFYDESSRFAASADQREFNALRRLLQSPADFAELKVVRHKFTPQHVQQLCHILAAKESLRAPTGVRPLSDDEVHRFCRQMERWHFCVHFLRDKTHQHNASAIWLEAKRLRQQLSSRSGWNMPGLTGASWLTGSSGYAAALTPSRWVRGLDIAGDENLNNVEIYAPAIRWLRDGLQASPVPAPATPGFHLSIHAGEDYAHPLSGMRHIDEVVQFCEMRSGDRLGHALALGIEPSDWCERHGEIVIPADEHFDNLVWAWHYATLLSARLPLASQVVPILQRRVLRLYKHISWLTTPDTASAGLADLYAAWRLRRNCYVRLQEYESSHLHTSVSHCALPDLHLLTTSHAPEVKIYRQRWQQQRCQPLFRQQGPTTAKPLQIRLKYLDERDHDQQWQHDKTDHLQLLEDHHTALEFEFFAALQDYLLDEYEQLGLIIEANPTCNISISRLDDYRFHPIFRWYPPDLQLLSPGEKYNRFGLRRGPVKVCVNTDDAGIMPTTLRTEFALLCDAAVRQGFGRTQSEDWVERLRQLGLHEFQRNHQQVWVDPKYRRII